VTVQNTMISLLDTLECVDMFRYFADLICAGERAEKASRARVRCACVKFRELAPVQTPREFLSK